MDFNPGINIGDHLTNNELCHLFKCGNMGGMRRSKKTDTLVIISDHTKNFYHDEWKDGVLHYTGMGKNGEDVYKRQDLRNPSIMRFLPTDCGTWKINPPEINLF